MCVCVCSVFHTMLHRCQCEDLSNHVPEEEYLGKVWSVDKSIPRQVEVEGGNHEVVWWDLPKSNTQLDVVSHTCVPSM